MSGVYPEGSNIPIRMEFVDSKTGDPYDLTGKTVTLILIDPDATQTVVSGITPESPETNGIAIYTPVSSILTVVGRWEAEAEDSDGVVTWCDDFEVRARKRT